MGCRLSTTPSEALPQTEEEEKYQLAVYLLSYKESHPADLAQISLLPKESQRSHWDCFYCAERTNDQVRCRKCRRVNLNKVEEVGLSESIAAALTQTEVIEASAINVDFLANTRVGMGRPLLANSYDHEQRSNPAVTEPIRVEEIKANSPIDPLSPNEIAEQKEDESAELSESTINKSGALIHSGSISLPKPKPRPVKSPNPDFIQFPPEPIQFPVSLAPSIASKKPKHDDSCCLLI